MSRCKSCDAPLPAATIYRTILIPHPTIEGQTTTMRVEEDFCARCANKSNIEYFEEESPTLEDLGVNTPEFHNYYD